MNKLKLWTYIILVLFLLITGFYYINSTDFGVKKASVIYFFMALSVLVLYDLGLRLKIIK